MMRILAIDPGCTESAYVLVDQADRRPVDFGKLDNELLGEHLRTLLIGDGPDFEPTIDRVAIEMIASYGMPVGAEVFETCVWIGRYQETVEIYGGCAVACDLVKRHPVKMHHCHSSKASDANVSQALKDRFAYGVSNHGKGTKTAPGWFYGFKADVWQAYALAVYVADTSPVSVPAVNPRAAGTGSTSDAPLQGEGTGRPTPTSEVALW